MIQHVALETAQSDGPAAAAFWQALGFEVVEPPASLRERAAWLERRGTQIHLLWTAQPSAQRAGHVAVVVDDYEATIDRLRVAGHAVEPRSAHWGAARAFLTAPGGHRVEVMAAAPQRTRFAEPLLLGAELARRVPAVLSELGIADGAVYDALVGLASVEHSAPLGTRDARARATYEAVGATVPVAA